MGEKLKQLQKREAMCTYMTPQQKETTFAQKQTVCTKKSREKAYKIRSVRAGSQTTSAGDRGPKTREPGPASVTLLYFKYRKPSPDDRVPSTREPDFAKTLLSHRRHSHRRHARYPDTKTTPI